MDIEGLHERGIIKTGQGLKLQSIMMYEDKEELLEYLGDILVVKHREVLSQQQEIERLKGDRWISVEDRLPEDGFKKLVYNRLKQQVTASHQRCDDIWLDKNGEVRGITHWQPLPAEPKEN